MGGCSARIESDSIVEAIEELRTKLNKWEEEGLWLDSISILVKDKKGYSGVGCNGMEVEVDKQYNKKPKKKVVILYHIHS